jgi:hypothetical protein
VAAGAQVLYNGFDLAPDAYDYVTINIYAGIENYAVG